MRFVVLRCDPKFNRVTVEWKNEVWKPKFLSIYFCALLRHLVDLCTKRWSSLFPFGIFFFNFIVLYFMRRDGVLFTKKLLTIMVEIACCFHF